MQVSSCLRHAHSPQPVFQVPRRVANKREHARIAAAVAVALASSSVGRHPAWCGMPSGGVARTGRVGGKRRHKRPGLAAEAADSEDSPLQKLGRTDAEAMTKFSAMTRKGLLRTVFKVAIWCVSTMVLSFMLFPVLRRLAWVILVGSTSDLGTLSAAAQNYVGHFLALMSLLFSILAGNSYASLYSQNEAIFYALFNEVSEAKSLMEQAALVCCGRPFYRTILECIKTYVDKDLRRLDLSPAVLLSIKPQDDPLESILYLTSVGIPSVIYETVKDLRQKRGDRLGAVQRKLPVVQLVLLYVLGSLTLTSFLLFSCSVQPSERWLCQTLFSLLSGALMMTMRVIHELWKPIGGAYNVDGVLAVMVGGL